MFLFLAIFINYRPMKLHTHYRLNMSTVTSGYFKSFSSLDERIAKVTALYKSVTTITTRTCNLFIMLVKMRYL
jgi:hypothetical protein